MSNLKGKAMEIVSKDKFSSGIITALVIAIVMVFNALLYTVVNIFDFRISYTEKFDYSLTGNTDHLFEEAIAEGREVKIYFCMSELDAKNSETVGEIYTTAQNFKAKYDGFVKLDFVNIITKKSETTGEYVNLSKFSTNMEGQKTTIQKTSVIFESGRNYRVVADASFFTFDSNMYITSYNGEEVMASMMSWVLSDEHKKAYFTKHHGESADIAFANLLACAGYYVEEIDLRKEKVPDDASLLLISNPTSDFEASKDSTVFAEMDRLEAYVERGGNIFVTLDPYAKSLPVLEGFLSGHGITLSTTEIASGKRVRNVVKDSENAITPDSFTMIAEYANSTLANKISATVKKNGNGGVMLRDVSAINLSGNAKALLKTSSSAVLEANGRTVSESGNYCIAAYSEYFTESGDKTNIFVVPSIYLAVSDALIANGYANKDFTYSLFEELYGAEGMPYGCEPLLYGSQVLENLTMGTARIYTTIALLIPTAILAVGVAVIIRRKYR